MSSFTDLQSVCCGDMVVSGHRKFVVYQVVGDTVYLLNLLTNPMLQHRADVAVDSWMDIVGHAELGGHDVVRCFPFIRARRTHLTRLGSVSVPFFERVKKAVQTERFIRRFEGSATLASNLMAAAHSSGRRLQSSRPA